LRKAAGPSFRQQRRPLAKCPTCNGTGMVQGLFHQMPCHDCNGGRVVDKETGEALPAEELVVQLTLWLERSREENRQLKRQLADERAKDNSRGYGAGGSRYHGD